MDFKGYFHIAGQQCHSLTILEDHSRFLLGLKACHNQLRETVKGHLTSVFRQYGLPDSFLVDNGPPWGSIQGQRTYTRLNAWLFRLDINVIHSRPFHPQTMDKDERLHRSLNAEVIKLQQFDNFSICQSGFDAWQHIYNYERPHEALAMDVPVSRYHPSQREFPEQLPLIEYHADDQIRKVSPLGQVSFRNRLFRVGRAFAGFSVAIRPTLANGEFDVYFCRQMIRTISFRQVQC